MKSLKKIMERVQKRGLWGTIKHLWKKYVFTEIDLVVLERVFDPPLPEHGQKVDWVIRAIEWPADKEHIARDYPSKVAHFDYRFDLGGMHAFACFKPQQVVAYVWSSEKPYVEKEYNYLFTPETGEVYQFDGYVHPEFRDGLTSRDTQQGIWTHLTNLGYKKCFCHVTTDNERSLYYHFKAGFFERGLIVHCKRLFHYIRWATEEPYTGRRFDKYMKRR